MLMIRDSSGNRSLTATLTVIGFGVVMLKVLLSGVIVGSVAFGTIDSLSIAAILGPILGAYTARRWGTTAPQDPPDEATGSNPSGGAA